LAGHLVDVIHSAAGGYAQGLVDVSRGAAGVIALDLAMVVDPVRAAEMIGQAAGAIATDDPAQRTLRYVQSIGRDGFWPATDTFVHDTAEQIPAVLLTALAGPELGAVPRVMSNLSYVGPFVPSAAAQLGAGRVDAVLRLSVPVGTAGTRRVALDPADGRFVVFAAVPGTVSTRKLRWSELDGDERAALTGAGIVDRNGRLRDRD
jgi:hypothetical protein